MSDTDAATVKRTTRTRKTATAASVAADISSPQVKSSALEDVFNSLLSQISEAKAEFLSMQRHIEDTKMTWVREQKEHELQIAQRDQQEETERKREQEAYDYETKLARRKSEDEFTERKARWERELSAQKEDIAKDRRELEDLRKQVAGFETEIEKAVKEATSQLERTLTASFTTEKKLREQEVKADKDLLGLKIANLSSENSRLTREIEELKHALEDATGQLTDVAVRVIDASNSQTRQATNTQPQA